MSIDQTPEAGGSRARTLAWLAGLAALATVVLSPALGTGYWAEDLYQSISYRAAMVIEGRSMPEVVLAHVKHTLSMGRFFPLTGALIPLSHCVFDEVGHYKAYLMAGSVVDLLLFFALVRKLTGRADFATLSACVTVGLIQYRLSIDPSFGFFGQMQLLIALLFLSLLALQQALDARPGWRSGSWLALSVAAYLGCALLYEVSYVLVLLHACLVARAGPGMARGLRVLSPFAAVVGFCAVQTLLFRWLHPAEIYWHETDLDPSAVAWAIACQVSAGLPLSYLLADPLDLFPGWRGGAMLGWLARWQVGLVALASFALAYGCLRRRGVGAGAPASTTGGIRGWGWLLAAGLILATTPSLLLAISPYHRAALSPGVGWIPVLIQVYGVGLVLSMVLWGAVMAPAGGGSGARWKGVVASAVVAVIVGATYRANGEVAKCFEATPGSERFRAEFGAAGGGFHDNRALLEAALKAGLMDEVPEHATVELGRAYPFWYDASHGRSFYAAWAGKAFDTVAASAQDPEATPRPGTYRVRDLHVARGYGSVLLARRPDPDGPARAYRLFVRHPRLFEDESPVSFRLDCEPREDGGPSIPVEVEDRQLPLVRSGPDWALYDIEPTPGPLPVDDVRVTFERPDAPAVATGGPSGTGPARR